MNMVSGLRRGGLLIDADVFVWREVWPKRGGSLKAVDARRLHSTNHKAELASSQRRVIEEQTPACATTRFFLDMGHAKRIDVGALTAFA